MPENNAIQRPASEQVPQAAPGVAENMPEVKPVTEQGQETGRKVPKYIHVGSGIGIGVPTSSIIRKLAEVRKLVADVGLSKGGKNDYTGFSYFELADFLPTINRYCEKVGILPVVTYDIPNKYAYMTILDTESEGFLVFSCPLGSVEVKNAQGIQQMGAMQTYARRYLYLTAFEIAEADSLDAEAGKEELIAQFKALGGNFENLLVYLGTTRTRITGDQIKEAIRLKQEEIDKRTEMAKNTAKTAQKAAPKTGQNAAPPAEQPQG